MSQPPAGSLPKSTSRGFLYPQTDNEFNNLFHFRVPIISNPWEVSPS